MNRNHPVGNDGGYDVKIATEDSYLRSADGRN